MNLPPNKRGQTVNADLVRTDLKQVDERRKALKAIGTFGLYTAPTMLALLKSAERMPPVLAERVLILFSSPLAHQGEKSVEVFVGVGDKPLGLCPEIV